MYYEVELSTHWPHINDPYPRWVRKESWVYTNKRAAKLKYREVCQRHSHDKYHEYGMRHGGPIMRVHMHDKYTSEIVVTLRRLTYTPKQLHEVKIIEICTD